MTKLLDFDILLDESFVKVCRDSSVAPTDKSFLLSMVNGYEEGRWRYNVFRNFVFNNLAETGLSARERNALADKRFEILVAAAQKLRIEKNISAQSGGEIGEIVLYGIMGRHFNALPVVPKIFYKQNANDYVKGADSVHIILNEKGDFELWLGEAKFYNSIEDARLDVPIASIEELLSPKKLRDENSLIVNLNELDEVVRDKPLCQQIRAALGKGVSLDNIKRRLHVPILLLHECNITKNATALNQAYKDAIIEYHRERANAYFKKQMAKLKNKVYLLEEIYFHLILFPVPCKDDVVRDFVGHAQQFQNDGNN